MNYGQDKVAVQTHKALTIASVVAMVVAVILVMTDLRFPTRLKQKTKLLRWVSVCICDFAKANLVANVVTKW